MNIIKSNKVGLLICIPDVFSGMRSLDRASRAWWIKHLLRGMRVWRKVTSPSRLYGNMFISRPYMAFTRGNAFKFANIFRRWRSIWANKSVLIVEGKFTRFGVGNDILANAKMVRRVICPSRDAYSNIDLIIEACLKNGRFDLCLVALGPTAKPVVIKLHALGMQAIDVGHLDLEYEWFLRGNDRITAVPGKAVNELSLIGSEQPFVDDAYAAEIIADVS